MNAHDNLRMRKNEKLVLNATGNLTRIDATGVNI